MYKHVQAREEKEPLSWMNLGSADSYFELVLEPGRVASFEPGARESLWCTRAILVGASQTRLAMRSTKFNPKGTSCIEL